MTYNIGNRAELRLKHFTMIYKEDAMEFMEESKVYRNVLKHRRTCKRWEKEFCLDCFGGGLTQFTKSLQKENLAKNKPSQNENAK